MSSTLRVIAVCVGKPRTMTRHLVEDDEGPEWQSGIYKQAQQGAVSLAWENLEGDGQADLVHHGGRARSLLSYCAGHYPSWEARLGRNLEPGSFGENLLLDGGDEDSICLGDIWSNDCVTVEVSQPRLPCYKLARRLETPGLNLEVIANQRGGWYSRTLVCGTLEAGDELKLESRPNERWSVRRAFRTYLEKQTSLETLEELASIPQLSKLWKDGLARRIRTHSEQTSRSE